jgi:hypothetical protein
MTPEEQNVMNSELFERLRKLETSVALLAQDVKAQGKAFETHDKNEMDKFQKVEDKLKEFTKLQNVALGIIIALALLNDQGIISLIAKLLGV